MIPVNKEKREKKNNRRNRTTEWKKNQNSRRELKQKCFLPIRKRGKRETTEGIELPNEKRIGTLGEN